MYHNFGFTGVQQTMTPWLHRIKYIIACSVYLEYTLLFKKQKNVINVITRDVDIRSIFFRSGWGGVFTLKSMGIACFLTPHSELYYSVIYLNGTSMNIEQKTFVQQVEP